MLTVYGSTWLSFFKKSLLCISWRKLLVIHKTFLLPTRLGLSRACLSMDYVSVALLYKKGLRFKRNSSIKGKFKSFEFTDLTMLHSSTSLRSVIVYRPPPSRNNNCTVTMFFNEFPLLLESLATTAGLILPAACNQD